MNHRHCLVAALLLGATCGAQAQVSFGIGAGYGKLGYTIESNTRQKWDGDANAATVGVDLAFPGGFYAALSHQQSDGGKLDFTFQGGAPLARDFKRTDSALTLGWSASNQLNTFVGVRGAETKIQNAIGTKFNTTGYFLGLSYPISLGRAGTLAITGAIGINEGKWTDTSGTAKENAFGASGGLRYVYSFTPTISASLGFKAQRYSYDFQSTLGQELKESVRLVDLGVNFNF